MLGGVGEKAGSAAAKELHEAVDGAIPAAKDALQSIEDRAAFSLAGLIADVSNRLHGAELPVDITVTASVTIHVSGKIGALKLSVPEYETGVAPSVVVKG